MIVCCASAVNMDGSRFIGLVFLTLSLVLLSNQMQAANDTDAHTDPSTVFVCPLMDFPNNTVNGTIVHNIKQTAECLNGREMPGCCITRFYCNFTTSNIDLSLYGPPGYRSPCSDICCPQNNIQKIPLPDDDDSDSSMDDSDSDENKQK